MNTRSKIHNKDVPITGTNKSTMTCSYCNIKGHKINKCEHESINELDVFGNSTIAIGYCTFGFSQRTSYTEFWLNSLNDTQIQMIGYKYSLGNKKYINNDLYIKQIINIYETAQMKHGYESNFKNIIFNLDYRILNKFYKDITECCDDINDIKQRLHSFRKFIKYPMKINNLNNLKQIPDEGCPICMIDNIKESNCIYMGCNHSVCVSCFVKMLYVDRNEMKTNVNCPLCRRNVDEISLWESNLSIVNRFCSEKLYNKQIEQMEKREIVEDTDIDFEANEQLQQTRILMCYQIIGVLKVALWVLLLCYCYINYIQ